MAGRGSRFSNYGIDTPKPLINIKGKPMVWWALQSLKGITYSKLIVVALAKHERKYGLIDVFRKMGFRDFEYVLLNEFTEGQLCTVLSAKDYINDDEEILITSSDTYVLSDLGKDIKKKSVECRGIISVANVPGEQWSFARTDQNGKVIEVAEKKKISNNVSTGIYYFSRGNEFLDTANEIIKSRRKTKGEYYIIPVFQDYINKGRDVRLSQAKQMWDMGTPEAKINFELFLDQNKY